jgi:deoxycytidylate deaminase
MFGKYNHYIKVAINESKKSDYKVKLGAVIFDKKKIISIGYNSLRNYRKLHPKYQAWKGSIHAEIDAILKSRKDLKGCTMIVIRINNSDELRMAKPCKKCMKYIRDVGIKKIIYSISNYPYLECINL